MGTMMRRSSEIAMTTSSSPMPASERVPSRPAGRGRSPERTRERRPLRVRPPWLANPTFRLCPLVWDRHECRRIGGHPSNSRFGSPASSTEPRSFASPPRGGFALSSAPANRAPIGIQDRGAQSRTWGYPRPGPLERNQPRWSVDRARPDGVRDRLKGPWPGWSPRRRSPVDWHRGCRTEWPAICRSDRSAAPGTPDRLAPTRCSEMPGGVAESPAHRDEVRSRRIAQSATSTPTLMGTPRHESVPVRRRAERRWPRRPR